MLTFLTNNNFFKSDWSPLIILKNSLFRNYSQHNDPCTSSLQKSFNNDKVLLMKSPNCNLEVQRKRETYKNPKLILNRLNIKKTDTVLIIDNKIYIDKIEMIGRDKTGRQHLVVKDGKTYFAYQNTENANDVALSTSVECSLLCKKNKIEIKTYTTNAENGCADSYIKPLRQINGNSKSTNTVIHSGVDSQEMLSISEVTSFLSHDRSLQKYNQDYPTSILQKKKGVRRHAIPLPKHLKRLNKKSPQLLPTSMFSGLKSVFSSRILHSANPSEAYSKSYKPFQNWCNDVKGKQNGLDETKTNVLKCLSGHKVSHRSKETSSCCKVGLERVDAKICFMGYFGLKPTVKTDVRKMRELTLLRRYNIKSCHVVISRAPVETKRKL